LSRVLAYGLIAWLHVLQPLARARGRLRGALTSPEFELAQDHSIPAPTWQRVASVLTFLAARGQALSFWSESWLSREALLTQVVERLRSTRVATALEVDAAWQRVRDVSMHLGRWGRLDVQMLVEEHDRGRVLVRIARRLHVTPFFVAAMTCLVAAVVTTAAAGSSRWLLAALVTVSVVAIRAAWHATATIALADAVMTRVLAEAGAAALGAPAVTKRPALPVAGARPVKVRSLDRPSTPHAA
jgi:hypothetical protein